MPLDEAHALVKSLLDETRDPDVRAKLVALQLALGWPHALEVAPEHLEALRDDELARSMPALRAQIWLAVAGTVAALLYLAAAAVALLLAHDPVPGVPIALGACIAVSSCVYAVDLANRRPSPAQTAALRSFAIGWWLWVALAAGLAIGDATAGAATAAAAVPSMFVALAAWGLARHTARR